MGFKPFLKLLDFSTLDKALFPFEIKRTSTVHPWDSFCLVDDCVQGVLRLTFSDYPYPLNIGSDEMISMNDLAKLAISFTGKEGITLNHIKGPQGVRGRNSENTLIKKVLGWSPPTPLAEGLNKTYLWIKGEIETLQKS